MVDINTDTKLVGLLGHPLKQSFSPTMQNGAFQEAGLNYIYVPFEVTPEDLPDVVKGISKMNFAGFNVTKPHKINIMDHLDEIDKSAEVIGAVNVVTISDGRLKGFNSDGSGFNRSFEEETGTTFKGKNVFILGSGGAARAIAVTLAMEGAEKIYICNRTVEKAEGLAADINKQVRDCASSVPLENSEMEKALGDTEVIINTTSIGMQPEPEAIPMDKELLDKRFIVCDIVYNPLKTKLLQEAEKLGCQTVEGLSMLLYQGAESFELWTGRNAPLETMESIIKKLI